MFVYLIVSFCSCSQNDCKCLPAGADIRTKFYHRFLCPQQKVRCPGCAKPVLVDPNDCDAFAKRMREHCETECTMPVRCPEHEHEIEICKIREHLQDQLFLRDVAAMVAWQGSMASGIGGKKGVMNAIPGFEPNQSFAAALDNTLVDLMRPDNKSGDYARFFSHRYVLLFVVKLVSFILSVLQGSCTTSRMSSCKQESPVCARSRSVHGFLRLRHLQWHPLSQQLHPSPLPLSSSSKLRPRWMLMANRS